MRSKKMLTKALSGILCAVTLMTSVPINAYADEADMVDQIVPRDKMREVISHILRLHAKKGR